MGAQVQLQGAVTIEDAYAAGGGYCVGGMTTVLQLALQYVGGAYRCVVSTDIPCAVDNADFAAPGLLEQLETVELLIVKSNAALTWRLNGAPATLVGSGGTFPTGFAGGETLVTEVDGAAAVTTTFEAADSTAADVAARINAAYALAGQPLPASVTTGGQVQLQGTATGTADGSVEVTGGTAQATLGFASGTNDSAQGDGEDIQAYGLVVLEADRSNPYTKVEVQGTASEVSILAAGTPA